MKEIYKNFKSLFFVFAMVLLSVFIWNNYEQLFQNPFAKEYKLDNPVFVSYGGDHNYYVVDKAAERISVISPTGEVERVIEGANKKTFFQASQLIADKEGRLYIDRCEMIVGKKTMQREEIMDRKKCLGF